MRQNRNEVRCPRRRPGAASAAARPVWVTVLAGLAGLLAGPSASALDPSRALTQYAHDSWTTREGLPQTTVHSIVQTPDGYLWLGTQVGLVRFDGVRFTVFDKTNSGLRNNHVWALLAAHDGALWMGTEGGGVTRLKDGQFTSFSTAEGLSYSIVRPVREGPDGAIWIGTEGGGVNRLKDGKVSRLSEEDHVRDVWALHVDRGGAVWIGTQGHGVSRFKDGEFTTYTTANGLPHDSVWYLFEDREGAMWIGTTAGLARLKDGRFRTYTTDDGLAGNVVRAIHEDRQGNLWIGTTLGLSRLREGRFESLRARHGLTHDFVRTIYEDREGSLWIGTFAGGLDRLRDTRFTVVGRSEGMADDIVRPVMEGSDGSLWMGTNSAGLYRMKDGRLTSYTTKQGLLGDSVLALAEGRDGSLWIGTFVPGLNRLKDGRLTSYLPGDGLPNASLRAILEARDGTVWVGTMEGLARLQGGQRFGNTLTTKDGLPANIVRSLIEGKDGRLWIGLTGGLACWRDGVIQAWTAADGLGSNAVESLYEDDEGVLWIGTNGGGLSRFEAGRFRTITTREGLSDDVVHAIVADGRGSLWLTSNRGISRIKRTDLDLLARGALTRVPSVSYDATDGMRSSECMGTFQPAGWRARDGRLWFPTMKGAVSVDPAYERSNPIAPPVVVEEVLSDGRPLAASSSPVVPAGTDRIAIRYTGLSLLVPSKVRFRYILENFDREWIDPGGRREAFYTKVPPGRYRFRVVACNDAGVWNEAGATLSFRVEPRVHQTGWFRGLAALLVVLGGWGLLRLRLSQLRAREEQLSLRVEERTRELQQEVADRKRAEEALQAYRATLEEQVAERTIELIQVNTQLQRDIAERERAQEAEAELRAALEEAAVEWERTFDSMEMPVLILDGEGRLARMNRAGRELARSLGQEEVLHRPVAEIGPGQPWQMASEMAQVVRTSGSLAHEQVRDAGTARTWDLAAGPSPGSPGEEDRIIVVARDITRMVELQESLHHSETMSAMGMLVAGVAHEVRNPLFGITANLDAFEVRAEGGTRAHQMVTRVRIEVERLASLMQGLLDYGKPVQSAPSSGSVESLAAEAVERCQGLGAEAGVTLVNRVGAGLPPVMADRGRLVQVLQNLLQNAIQHSPKGSAVIVNAEREDAESGPWVVLKVSDSGPGIEAADLPHVFEPFFSKRRGGTGLGLAIAYRIVVEHGGTISAANRPEGGAMMAVRLPCAGVRVSDPSVPRTAHYSSG